MHCRRLALLVALSIPLALADGPARSDEASATAESVSLFNGKDLAGWYADVPEADDNPNVKPSFLVRDGKLVSMGVPRGHLITKKSFKDYRLEVEYRFAGKPGNCGVLVHTDGKRSRALYKMFPASLEVQMQHQAAGDFWCIHEDIKVPNMEQRRKGPKENWGGKQGQSRHIRNLTDGSEKPLGEWNTMVVECLGDKIRVWVNGDLVNDGYDCTAKQGQISLQAEGAEVEFRKLQLTPITRLTEAKETASAEADKITVLLVDGQNNHDWKRCSPVMKATLEATGRFTVETATVTKEVVADFAPDFTQYDVVLSNYNGSPWPEKTKASFEKYVEEGGNLVVVHAADNSFPDWKEYNLMIGLGGWGGRNEFDGPYVYWKDGKVVRDNSKGRGGAHGRPWEYKVVVREKEHPITRGLPSEFLQAKEELYDRLRGPAENMTILATALATGGSERHEPVLMTITYGKGRIFHTVMGHDAKSMLGVAFQETLIRGTEWAATGKVTFPPVSADVLPVDRAASRDPKEIKPVR